MLPKLLLFDIDQTLIKTMKIASDPWKLTFEEVYGFENSTGLKSFDTSGKTHKRLVVEGLFHHGITREIDSKEIQHFLKILEKNYSDLLGHGEVELFPKVKEILTSLSECGHFLGLVTGNTERIAYEKLKTGGIDSFFRIGGFGDRAMDREQLVEHALEGAKSIFQRKFLNNDIFVIGDTPLDVESAKYHNLQAVGVTTGKYSKSELEKGGANFVLDELSDIRDIL